MDLKNSSSEKLGAEFFTLLRILNNKVIIIRYITKKFNNFIGDFLQALIKSYSFDKYKTKKNDKKISIWQEVYLLQKIS